MIRKAAIDCKWTYGPLRLQLLRETDTDAIDGTPSFDTIFWGLGLALFLYFLLDTTREICAFLASMFIRLLTAGACHPMLCCARFTSLGLGLIRVFRQRLVR